jgi:transposase InsO family protein
MDAKVQFVVAARQGELSMAAVCRQFGISRKTGYALLHRYQTAGVDGLKPRSRAPHQPARGLVAGVEEQVLAARAQHPTWGPRTLVRALAGPPPAGAPVVPGPVPASAPVPAASTVGAILKRHGLVVPRRRRPAPAGRTAPLAHADGANTVWCADFKGQFQTADGAWCYPLTISDAHSRYLLRCQAQAQGHTDAAHIGPLFEATFREYGLPEAIRTDNGPPFASRGLGGLTPLAVQWVKLGIRLERIRPGQPQENGRHERLHRTLSEDAITPAAATLRTQQQAFDAFRASYNQQRPHEALAMATPASVYAPSSRPFPERPVPLSYPEVDQVRQVRTNGTIRWRGALLYLSESLVGEPVGLTWVADGQWRLAFGTLVLGILDDATTRIYPVCERRPGPPAG